jgi:hypothetical protein
MKTLPLSLLATVLVLAGCASSNSSRINPAGVNWNERVGSYTYDEAIRDLGKPAVVGETSAGRTAEWILRRGPRMSFGFGVGAGSFGSHTGVGVGVGSSVSPPPRGENLRLEFDREGRLKAWSKIRF